MSAAVAEPRAQQLVLSPMSRHEELRLRAERFDAAHPCVWALFERFALEKIGQGYGHYSAKAVMERVRWETDASGDPGDAFKINDHVTAFYARKFARTHPRHADFFRFRKQTSREADARGSA